MDIEREGALAARFAELTRTLLDATTVAGALERIVVAAGQFVPSADLVSVTLRGSDGTFHTPVETEHAASELDQLQYKFDEGPCLDAAREPGPAVGYSGDLGTSASWPQFGPAAAERGYHSALATALTLDAKPPRLGGALNIFSSGKASFSQSDANVALLLATHASLALAHTRALDRAELQAEHLRKALDSRDVIGQAKGILMNRRGVDAEKAFDILRRTSQDLNVKLSELANTLATRHLDLDL
ncbi:GAF and ANTAR domain-containing protein [Amycolatopsis xylanica]|nr:GAF and ANTAR domain-containing protein [Amycolatopsis xylanica]